MRKRITLLVCILAVIQLLFSLKSMAVENSNNTQVDKVISIQYKSHIQNIGWQGSKTNGQTSGTSGKSLRMEAIRVSLINAPEGASVIYSAHVQNIGWQNWKKDNEIGRNRRQIIKSRSS